MSWTFLPGVRAGYSYELRVFAKRVKCCAQRMAIVNPARSA
jgi:hypothetical protein